MKLRPLDDVDATKTLSSQFVVSAGEVCDFNSSRLSILAFSEANFGSFRLLSISSTASDGIVFSVITPNYSKKLLIEVVAVPPLLLLTALARLSFIVWLFNST